MNNTITINLSNKEKYQCPICYKLMYEPIQMSGCGHNLCGSCYRKVDSVCPLCRQKSQGFSDVRLNREMLNEIVHCTCGENVFFAKLAEHMKHCIFVQCRECKSSVARTEFSHHAEICSEFFVECQKCMVILRRKDIPIHSQFYCTKSETCLKIPCQICKHNPLIPVTTFQKHYEQEHLGRTRTIVILPRYTPTFTIE